MKNDYGHLRLSNLVFRGKHGHYPQERELGNRFEVDIDLKVDLTDAIKTDRLEESVDLEEVYEVVRRTIEGEPKNLIETLAADISSELVSLGRVQSVTVRVRKLNPPLPGLVQGVMEAEITHGP
ncbi:dihydroneopterin aldolase [candidate division LCP-89 bacterium B3_LCP]|uniref:7,8-dihydroneopterin aldolase n=1 Tax=candidate division LCP-89 bacterium B3_LCP TaxID=2012998 RepID=A0A532V1N9_UNCL8|nr:MAG: dihydroneopterin aldolase [candidate division LCP-89 bacterium B3_LCP]